QTFPTQFLARALGGGSSTFSKVGPQMLSKQVVVMPEMIKANPDVHSHAPIRGYHGALTMVDGREGAGEVGRVYPLFRRVKEEWDYAGQYKVARRVIVPVEVWKSWPDDVRRGSVKQVEETAWGQVLLQENSIALNDDEL